MYLHCIKETKYLHCALKKGASILNIIVWQDSLSIATLKETRSFDDFLCLALPPICFFHYKAKLIKYVRRECTVMPLLKIICCTAS